MSREIVLTREGVEALESELEHLSSVRRREVGERIKEAKEFGDLSENSEYEDAKNEQAFVEARISEIHQILANATVAAEPTRVTKVVIGSRVSLKNLSTGDEFSYRLVGSAEADPAHDKISNESPVGKALMGAKKGDMVKVTVPSGSIIEFEVLGVRK